MTTTETTGGVEPLGTYPKPYNTRYGVSVWCLGEDGDDGLMAAGHGRRAYAALNAEARAEDPPWWYRDRLPRNRSIERLWALFYVRCGHTDAEHETHLAGDLDCDCDQHGLPPCDDRYAWRYVAVPAGTEGALPVLVFDA